MRSGFDRIGYGGLLLLILTPVALYALARSGAAAYCAREEGRQANRRCLLAGMPATEAANAEAHRALALFRHGAPGEAGSTEGAGRWLRDKGKSCGVETIGLLLGKNAADPTVTVLRASFRVEDHIGRLLPFFHGIQADARLVSFESLRLRRSDRGSGFYVADVVLSMHVLTPKSTGKPSFPTRAGLRRSLPHGPRGRGPSRGRCQAVLGLPRGGRAPPRAAAAGTPVNRRLA
jgi:hypothetical protein